MTVACDYLGGQPASFQPKLGVFPNNRDVFHSMSKFAVGSTALATITLLYLISTCDSLGSDGG